MTRNVTVGLDGTAEGLAAAEWGAREALLRGVPLHLVHVEEGPSALTRPAITPEMRRTWAEEMLERLLPMCGNTIRSWMSSPGSSPGRRPPPVGCCERSGPAGTRIPRAGQHRGLPPRLGRSGHGERDRTAGRSRTHDTRASGRAGRFHSGRRVGPVP